MSPNSAAASMAARRRRRPSSANPPRASPGMRLPGWLPCCPIRCDFMPTGPAATCSGGSSKSRGRWPPWAEPPTLRECSADSVQPLGSFAAGVFQEQLLYIHRIEAVGTLAEFAGDGDGSLLGQYGVDFLATQALEHGTHALAPAAAGEVH